MSFDTSKRLHNLLLKYRDIFNENKNSSRMKIQGLIRITDDYYKLSIVASTIWKDNIQNYFENNNNNLKDRAIVGAFGIYTNGNICLQATKGLNKHFIENFKNKNKFIAELNKIRNEYIKFVKKFTDNRNIITSHPFRERELDQYVIPTGIDQQTLLFDLFDLNNSFLEQKLELNSDITKLGAYLDKLISVYQKLLDL